MTISKRFGFVRSKTARMVLAGLVFVVFAAACSSDGGRGDTPALPDPSVVDSSDPTAPDEATTTTVEDSTTSTTASDETTTTVAEEATTTSTTVHDDDGAPDNQTVLEVPATTTAAPPVVTAPTTTATPTPTTAPPTTAPPQTAAAPTTTTTTAETTIEPTPTTTTIKPIYGGTPDNLAGFGDECPGTVMGRFHVGQPTGCLLDDGTVLCLTAAPNPTDPGNFLFNAAEWLVCPNFDPDRPACDTSQTADHGYIEQWEHVITSADQESYIRPIWEGTVDLTPGLWFGELCVRNNEGSQLGIVGPQDAFARMSPTPACDGLPGFATTANQNVVPQISNGTQPLRAGHTGWIGGGVFRCTDRNGPYPYKITMSAVNDWVFRLGKANMGFEVGTFDGTADQMNDWVQERHNQLTGS